MAFSTGFGERSAFKSPREESSPFAPFTSPLRSVGSQLSPSASDPRGTLHRRFTTNNMPTLNTPLSPIGMQRRQAAEPQEFSVATVHKLQVLEKKKLEYKFLREQSRRIELEMELLHSQAQQEDDAGRMGDVGFGKHSQPTTPPEYTDFSGFPTVFSRPNRFSMSSVNSGGVITPRGSRSGSFMSPPSTTLAPSVLPSQSLPESRRGSDEENDEPDHDHFATFSPVARNANRMSMPVNFNQRVADDDGDGHTLGPVNTTGFLFDEDDNQDNSGAATNGGAYLHMSNNNDGVPVLLRRDTDVTASASGESAATSAWPAYRHHAQQSLPTNILRKGSFVEPTETGMANSNLETTPTRNSNRHSVEYAFTSPRTDSKRSSFASPTNGTAGMPKLQQSFSANNVPTMKNAGMNGMNGNRSHAEQHYQNHNANIGRVPNGVNRHSRELSSGFKDIDASYRSPPSTLHASAAPFGPALTAADTLGSAASQYATANAPAYNGYGMNMLNGAMGNMSIGPQAPGFSQNANFAAPMGAGAGYYPPNPYATYTNGRLQDSQARVIQSRRAQSDASRFLHYDLKTMPRTEIYTLCKDQHGCRFLQKKLEERNPEYLDIIFEETADHVIELMTDPFGNYLCQKLLEYCNDEQRDTLVSNASSQLVQIALNQHGTRALQKMIEFISTPKQIQIIVEAFQGQVVDLIQDLNGNHVIQKCLNHLKAEDAQFIFDAVGENCVTVGTHRHGCCVLQRCIDHASGFQKVQLVRQITANSFHLVQDPFGNYVVQYILDLNDPSFTGPMCVGFQGHVAELAKQKFSSNVIEKCIRCADMPTKRLLIEEMMHPDELEKLMRDSYGNYVIQTALEFSPADQCVQLIDSMRPILPTIRQTPYGRRIQSKVQERESRIGGYAGRNAVATPMSDVAGAFAPHPSGYQAGPMFTGTSYGSNIAAPRPHRLSNPPLPNQLQNSVQRQQYHQHNPSYSNGFF